MTNRTRIAGLAQTPDGTTVTVGGFVDTVRDQKKVQFIILRDESGSAQLVNPALREDDPEAGSSPERRALTDSISELSQGTFVRVTGELKLDERVKLSFALGKGCIERLTLGALGLITQDIGQITLREAALQRR